MDRILNMVMRMVMRKVLNRGIDKGLDMAMGGSKNAKGGHGVSDEDRAEMEAMRAKQKRAKQAMRVGRRMTKL
ncbi:MAG: hypothetical protein AAFP28_12030 [Pseudomonadota bacterium]